jgi:hypothetical protein
MKNLLMTLIILCLYIPNSYSLNLTKDQAESVKKTIGNMTKCPAYTISGNYVGSCINIALEINIEYAKVFIPQSTALQSMLQQISRCPRYVMGLSLEAIDKSCVVSGIRSIYSYLDYAI